jgi:hypothetical protein
MGPLKDRPGANCEVQLAGVAAVETACPLCDPLAALAAWAGHAHGPNAILQVVTGGALIGEQLEELEGADCGSGHLHAPPTKAPHGMPSFYSPVANPASTPDDLHWRTFRRIPISPFIITAAQFLFREQPRLKRRNALHALQIGCSYLNPSLVGKPPKTPNGSVLIHSPHFAEEHALNENPSCLVDKRRLGVQAVDEKLAVRNWPIANCFVVFHAFIVLNSLTGVKYFLRFVFKSMGVKYIIPLLYWDGGAILRGVFLLLLCS